jgi:tRNA pseudouridine38-40 synthase
VSDVPDGFNARFDATSKTYRYLIVNGETCSPFDHGRVWHVRHPLDADAVRAAAAIVEGRHDFSAFQSARAPVTSPIRRVFRSELLVEDNACDRIHAPAARLLTYEIAGSGFLRHMVRVIVGTLVDIGQGRWPPDAVSAILSSRDRTRAGRTAPAEGLYLVQVDYGRSDEREQGEGDEEA